MGRRPFWEASCASDMTRRFDDKVPVLGDIPWFGRLFQSKVSERTKKNLLIFVTAKLIRSNGKPQYVHALNAESEEEGKIAGAGSSRTGSRPASPAGRTTQFMTLETLSLRTSFMNRALRLLRVVSIARPLPPLSAGIDISSPPDRIPTRRRRPPRPPVSFPRLRIIRRRRQMLPRPWRPLPPLPRPRRPPLPRQRRLRPLLRRSRNRIG